MLASGQISQEEFDNFNKQQVIGVGVGVAIVAPLAIASISPVAAALVELTGAVEAAALGGPIAVNRIKSAEARAKELHSALDPRAQRMRTTAVTETKEGTRFVSSSNPRLSPAQRAQLGRNEIEGVGKGHAEVTGINAARNAGLTPIGTAASRPICSNCANTLKNQGIDPLSPLK